MLLRQPAANLPQKSVNIVIFKEVTYVHGFITKNIGIAITGSYCTYKKCLQNWKHWLPPVPICIRFFPIMLLPLTAVLENVLTFLSRQKNYRKETDHDHSGCGTDRTGGPFDILVIAPCTGNTLSKLANGISDTPVLMAAKAHLRNNRPLVVALSTNDALGMNLKNIGILLNTKNIYFIPFGQDNYKSKPNSMIAHIDLLTDTIEAALETRQLQPVIQGPDPK